MTSINTLSTTSPDPITAAALWLAEQPQWNTGLRRELRSRFSLDGFQIAEAVEQARKMQVVRRAFG